MEATRGWVRIITVMDSGAAESGAPPNIAPRVPIEESPGSRKGQHYVSASKERVPNMGHQKMSVVTNEGRKPKLMFQVAEGSRPLTAVSATCDAGSFVYGPRGGVIHNVHIGERTKFERRSNLRARPVGPSR